MVPTIVSIVVLILIVVGVVLLVDRNKKAKRARLDAMSPEERAVYDAEAAHVVEVKQATKALQQAEKTHDGEVKTAERALRKANDIGRGSIGSYGEIAAWQDHIKTKEGAFPMTSSVSAKVDTAGNIAVTSRSTFTRMALGAVVAGPFGLVAGAAARKSSTIDSRELWLMVEGEGFGSVVKCEPNDAERVRKLAMAINTAASSATAVMARRDAAIKSATSALEVARAATGPVDSARLALEAAQANTGAVDTAKAAMEAAQVRLAIAPLPAESDRV